jgi:hypothetical protein
MFVEAAEGFVSEVSQPCAVSVIVGCVQWASWVHGKPVNLGEGSSPGSRRAAAMPP